MRRNEREKWLLYHKRALNYLALSLSAQRPQNWSTYPLDWHYHALAYDEKQGLDEWKRAIDKAFANGMREIQRELCDRGTRRTRRRPQKRIGPLGLPAKCTTRSQKGLNLGTHSSMRPLSSSIKWVKERPARSRFQTTNVSPARTYASASSSPFFSAFDPVILSTNHFSHPASFSASNGR